MGGYMKKFGYIILILIISCTAVACGKVQSSASSENKKGKEVKSDLIIADRDIDTFKFTNASLIVNDNSSTFKVFMTNTSDSSVNVKKVIIKFYDESSNLIATMEGVVLGTIDAKETKILSASHYEKLDNAHSLNYEIIK